MNLKDTMNNNNYTISWLNELSNKKAENPNLKGNLPLYGRKLPFSENYELF